MDVAEMRHVVPLSCAIVSEMLDAGFSARHSEAIY